MDFREEFEWVRARLKKELKTESAIALKLKMSPQTLNNQYNHGEDNLLKTTFNMFDLLFVLKNKDNGYGGKPLVKAIFKDMKARLTESDTSSEPALQVPPALAEAPCFDRVDAAVLFQEEGGERRGCPPQKEKKNHNAEEKNSDCDFSNPYADKNVAERYGLGGVDTFRCLKAIRLSGRQELRQAVNTGLIKPHCAYKFFILTTPTEAEAILGTQNKKKIRAFIREKALAAEKKPGEGSGL